MSMTATQILLSARDKVGTLTLLRGCVEPAPMSIIDAVADSAPSSAESCLSALAYLHEVAGPGDLCAFGKDKSLPELRALFDGALALAVSA